MVRSVRCDLNNVIIHDKGGKFPTMPPEKRFPIYIYPFYTASQKTKQKKTEQKKETRNGFSIYELCGSCECVDM